MDEDKIKREMSSVIELVSSDLSSLRTGRASPALVEDIIIPAYGGTQKLKIIELGSINAPDPQTIVIDPWDKSIIGEIRQGLLAANLGLTPIIAGEVIRLSLPPLTTEDREKYVKLLRSKLEQGKVMIRHIRSDTMRDLKKAFEDKTLSEDQKFASEKRTQELTDQFISQIDSLGEAKQKELLSS